MNIQQIAGELYPQYVQHPQSADAGINRLVDKLIDQCEVSKKTAQIAAAQVHAEHQQLYVQGIVAIDLAQTSSDMLVLNVNGKSTCISASFLALAMGQAQLRSVKWMDS